MEEDDEFGDLYTDVIRPLATSFQSQSQSQQPSGPPPHAQQKEIPKAAASATSFQKRPIDLNLNSDDDEDESFYAPNSNSAPQNQTVASAKTGSNFRPGSVGFDLNKDSSQRVGNFEALAGVESDVQSRVSEKEVEDRKLPESTFGGSGLMDEPDIDVVVEDRDDKDDDFVVKDDNLAGKTGKVENFIPGPGNVAKFGTGGGESKDGDMSSDPILPGVSIPGVSGGVDSRANANFEDDWDSDSEDDLQIVLNDNNHGPMGMDRMGGAAMGDDEDDEDGEPLVIVADNDDPNCQPMMMEEQEWGSEEVGPSGDGDRKELGDAARVNGVGVAVAPKIGYSNHGYHHPFHSQFKYVRPGAAPMPGAAPTGPGGTPGQVRPPGTMVPGVGRGRGDWRPTGIKSSPAMQKGFHPGYGMPVWGSGASGRGYGSGLEFTLPSHKTIFEVDIDSFEEKPWKLPGIDMTDFFNFGLNEESWKDYCKLLEQLRLETTMQNKIRVYESGRTEQDYDPDLPPELAAAAGIQEIPSESAKLGKTDASQNDLAKGLARVRPPLPTGRPIQVETGYGERLPSIDTRKPRISDMDVIIEIVCQDSADDESYPGNDTAEQQDNDLPRQEVREGDEFEDLPQDDSEHNHFPNSYNNRNMDSRGRRLPISKPVPDNVREGLPHSSEASPEYQPDAREQTAYPGQNFPGSHEERRSKARAQGRAREKSPSVTNKESTKDKGFSGDKKEESIESIGGKRSPAQLSPVAVKDAPEQEIEPQDTMSADDEVVRSERDFDVDKEEVSLNATTNHDTLEDDTAKRASKKQKLIQSSSQEIDDGEDSRTARSSENSKARSGSSKDYPKLHDGVEEEEVQDGRSTRMANVKRSVSGDEDITRRKVRDERQENERQRTLVKGREDLYPHKSWDSYSGSHSQAKYESIDRRKESENTDGFCQRRDEDLHGRRSRFEETRKREHRDEAGFRHRTKVREIERSEKDDHQLRKQLDNGSWRGSYDKDIGSRHRDRDDIPKSRNESIDDLHSKRRKEEAHLRREHAEKEETLHTRRENSSRRKRERDDVYDQRRRDDQVRVRDDDPHYVRLKEEGLFQRERNERQREREEWHRIKQSNEEISAKKDKEEARVGKRSGRAMEDRAWGSQSRGKDEHRSSDKEYHSKDAGRPNEPLKRRDRVDSESLSQYRGREDVHGHGSQLNSDERRARHERGGTHDDRAAVASDKHKVQDKKQKEYPRKAKESDVVERNPIALSKKNQEENSGQISDMGSLKGRLDQESRENEILVNNHPSRKHNREGGSSDDEQPESGRGRSKLERWTSHKERDFSIGTKSSSSMKIKQIDSHNSTGPDVISKLPDQASNTVEDKLHSLGSERDAGNLETNNSNQKAIEDKHLDTVEKLKKRSERFKLPMPSEKEVSAIKKTENEPLPPVQSENRADSEIKAERPARKRRWTSN